MPIQFTKETQSWSLVDMAPEEYEYLVEKGKEEFVKAIAFALFAKTMPMSPDQIAQRTFLEALNPQEMGSA